MKKVKMTIALTGVIILLFSLGKMSGSAGNQDPAKSDKQVQTKSKTVTTNSKSVQTKPKSISTGSKTIQTKSKSTTTGSKTVQTKSKSGQTGTKSATTKSKTTQKSPISETDNKIKDTGTVRIGNQTWSVLNLNVSTFRNGDSIPEAKTNTDWVKAGESGKPAWCYYNNDAANGPKYGKLYNWFAVNDPRGLAPEGWSLSGAEDWAELGHYLGGAVPAGSKMKSSVGWTEGYNGTNESGFTGLPGGYRIENGKFLNLGSIGIWWSSTESKSLTAIDHYLAQSNSLSRSNNPKAAGESVRCIRK